MNTLDKFPPYDHVIDGVYISGYRATRYPQLLRIAKILNVLKLYEGEPYFPSDFNTLDNALEDGEEIPDFMLRRGAEFILKHVELGQPVLVMCAAGISRSSTFVLAYLLEKGYDLKVAFELLSTRHSDAHPHPLLWESLIRYYKLPYDLDQVLEWDID